LLASPLYTAWRLYAPGEVKVNVEDAGTKPFTTVTVELRRGLPEQEAPE
jgi:hypothetical protein